MDNKNVVGFIRQTNESCIPLAVREVSMTRTIPNGELTNFIAYHNQRVYHTPIQYVHMTLPMDHAQVCMKQDIVEIQALISPRCGVFLLVQFKINNA